MYHPVFGAPRERREDIHDVTVGEGDIVLHVVTVHQHDAGQVGGHAEPGDQRGNVDVVGEFQGRTAVARTSREIPGERGVKLDGDPDQRGPAMRRRSPGRIESCRSRLFIRRTSPALMP